MAGLASINIKFSADLKQFSSKMQNATRSIKSMGKQLTNVGKGLSIGVTAPFVALGIASLNTASNFERLEGRLKTSFKGSEDAAKKAFKTIIDFTSKTPFQVEEVADAFIKLKNLGLEPSENALTSYGNTAAAMGKSLNQLIEAVADAATGEFERLKEFGIKSKSQGDKVSFTFQGITKTVGKNAAEITNYLQDLGNVNFAGAMDELSTTFEGSLSNLKDSLSLLGNEFGKIIIGYIKPFIGRLKDIVASFQALSPETKKIIVVFGSLAAAIGPILVTIGFLMTTVVPGLITAFGGLKIALIALNTAFLANPIGIMVAGVVALSAAIVLANSRFVGLTDVTEQWTSVNDKATASIAKEKTALQRNLLIAKDENKSKEERLNAIKSLKTQYPDYLGFLNLETVNTDKTKTATDNLIGALLQKAKVMAAQDKLVEVEKKLLDLQLGITDAVDPSLWQQLGAAVKGFGGVANSQISLSKSIASNFKEEESALISLQDKLTGFLSNNETLVASLNKTKKVTKEVNTELSAPTSRKKQTSITEGLTPVGVNLDIANPIIAEGEKVDGALSDINSKFIDFSLQTSQIISQTASNALAGFGEMIAGLAAGSLTMGDVAGGLLKIVGDMAIALGEAAIEIGVGMLAIKLAFKNPYLAIAAGVALVAIGTLISSAANITSGADAGAFANGGIVGGSSFSGDKLFARVNSGEMILNQRQQNNLGGLIGAGNAQAVNVTLQPSIDFVGDKFRIMLDKVNSQNSRKR